MRGGHESQILDDLLGVLRLASARLSTGEEQTSGKGIKRYRENRRIKQH